MTRISKKKTLILMCDLFDEDEVVMFSIPLNRATIERLMNLSAICHADPIKVAASLLHDVLKDDDEANAEASITHTPRLHLN